MPITEKLRTSLSEQNQVIKDAEDHLGSIPTALNCSVEIDDNWDLCFLDFDDSVRLHVVWKDEDQYGEKIPNLESARPLMELPITLRTAAVGVIPDLIDEAESVLANFDKEVDANNELVRSRLRKNS